MATQIKISELPLANESALSLAADDRFIFNNDNVNTQTIKFANLVDAICEQNLTFTGNCQFTQSIVGPDGGDLNNGLDDMNDVQLQNVQSGQLLQYSGTQWINIDSKDLDQDLSAYAPIDSPTFTGNPAGPTVATTVNTTQLATCGHVYTHYAPIASAMLTGSPTAPTPATGNNSTAIATTAFVLSSIAANDVPDNTKADVALIGVAEGSQNLGTLTKPDGYPGATNIVADNSTVLEAVQALNDNLYTYKDVNDTALNGYAPLADANLTGTPTAPTAGPGTSTTQIATTAFVAAAVAAGAGIELTDLSVVTGVATAGGALAYNNGNGTFTFQPADLSTYAPLADAALTGAPTAPTAAANTNTTQLATTEFVTTAVAALDASALRTLLGIKEGADAGGAGAASGELFFNTGSSTYVVAA